MRHPAKIEAPENVGKANRKPRSLPAELWPEADRIAWAAACRPGTRLKRGGAASHLKPVTRDDHALHYGNFFGFLDRSGLLQSDGQPAANVMPERVDAFITEMQQRVSSVTVHGSICRLRRVAKFIAAKQLARAIRTTTLSTVGVAVSPHLFRTSAASTAASRAGENPHLASALLHHAHPSVTNDHYNRATSMSAAEHFGRIIRQYAKNGWLR
jgi:hypothetical protein